MAKANNDLAIMRFEMLEVVLRVAMLIQKDLKHNDVSESLEVSAGSTDQKGTHSLPLSTAVAAQGTTRNGTKWNSTKWKLGVAGHTPRSPAMLPTTY